MKRLLAIAVVALAALTPASAGATVIHTNWVETQQLRAGATLRVSVRRIEVTRTTWRARVGVTNLSSKRVRITTGAVPGVGPFVYYAGPALMWPTHVSAGLGGYALIHSLAARSVQPRLPSSLGPHQSWFATIGGSSAKLPRGRLISVCFGIFAVGGEPTAPGTSGGVVTTTHSFKLPPR